MSAAPDVRLTSRSTARSLSSRQSSERSAISTNDLRRPEVRLLLGVAVTLTVVVLLVISAGPLLWLAKAAVSTSQDILKAPLGLWPSGIQWSNLSNAWNRIEIGRYTGNTFVLGFGGVVLDLVVAATGGFVLSVLKPRYGKVLMSAVLATLFIPGIISLVPRYLTVLDLGLMDSFWAVWLPGAASAFNVLIMMKFFDTLDRGLFDAAKVDGAGPLAIFWHLALPMTKPILGVLALLSFMSSWKEFLWPLLVLPTPARQPLSVALTKLQTTADQGLVMAAMFITVLIPIALFLLFQRQFLRAAGSAGGMKE